jgi:ATP-dependent DNA helicase RecG
MVHPEYALAATAAELPLEARITPVYPLTTGITQGKLRQLILAALALGSQNAVLKAPLRGLSAPCTIEALEQIHRPERDEDAAALLAMRHPAITRVIQEELLAHQLCMRLLRNAVKLRPAPALQGLQAAQAELARQLPFALTKAQARVAAEVGQDLAQARPMLRLVQGDVGSGKTVVAALALLTAARSGWQAVLMAPTDLLAEQHAATLTRWFAPLGLRVCFLAGKLKKSAKTEALQAIADGGALVVVGTHALFQQDVAFQRLGVAVVDEQHRFGVAQRLALRDKGPLGYSPHQLIMSATPIPRTLAQTLYADLDVSVIDELPPGRTPVSTTVLNNDKRAAVVERVGAALRAGKQAYWVCTLIEESDELQAQAAETLTEQLRAALPELHIGLVHGRMKAAEKEAQMAAFKAAATQLLVATTVIEVGVDVPNASIMVIENAERLGLSQLHQLRGRVGRGAVESQCLLLYQAPLGQMAKARLNTLRETTDGFVIAEKDLELRGPGELLGARQTGLVGLKVAEPQRDAHHLPRLQALADEWLEHEPVASRMLIRRWVGDVERYAQV